MQNFTPKLLTFALGSFGYGSAMQAFPLALGLSGHQALSKVCAVQMRFTSGSLYGCAPSVALQAAPFSDPAVKIAFGASSPSFEELWQKKAFLFFAPSWSFKSFELMGLGGGDSDSYQVAFQGRWVFPGAQLIGFQIPWIGSNLMALKLGILGKTINFRFSNFTTFEGVEIDIALQGQEALQTESLALAQLLGCKESPQSLSHFESVEPIPDGLQEKIEDLKASHKLRVLSERFSVSIEGEGVAQPADTETVSHELQPENFNLIENLKQLEKQLQEKGTQVAELEKKLRGLHDSSRLSSVKQNFVIKELQGQLTDLSQQLGTDQQATQNEIHALQQEKEKGQQALAENLENLNKLKSELKNSQDEHQKLQAQMTSLQGEREDEKASSDRNAQAMNALQLQLEKQLQEKGTQVAELEEKLRELHDSNRLSSVKQDFVIKELQDKLTDLSQQLGADQQATQNEIHALQQEKEKGQQTLAENLETLNELKSQLENSQGENKKLQGQMTSLQQEKLDEKKSFDRNAQAMNELQSQLEKQLQEKGTQVAELEKKLRGLHDSSRLSSVKQDFVIKELQDKLADSNQQLDTVQQLVEKTETINQLQMRFEKKEQALEKKITESEAAKRTSDEQYAFSIKQLQNQLKEQERAASAKEDQLKVAFEQGNLQAKEACEKQSRHIKELQEKTKELEKYKKEVDFLRSKLSHFETHGPARSLGTTPNLSQAIHDGDTDEVFPETFSPDGCRRPELVTTTATEASSTEDDWLNSRNPGMGNYVMGPQDSARNPIMVQGTPGSGFRVGGGARQPNLRRVRHNSRRPSTPQSARQRSEGSGWSNLFWPSRQDSHSGQ